MQIQNKPGRKKVETMKSIKLKSVDLVHWLRILSVALLFCALFASSALAQFDPMYNEEDQSNPGAMAGPDVTNQPPRLVSLEANIQSPQEPGSTITWMAEARDADSDPILYLFLLNGQPVTDWQSRNQWQWTATDADIGDNQITVWIRDGNHATGGGVSTIK